MSAVILKPKKRKSVTASTFSPSICYEVMGLDAMILVFWILSFKPTFSLSSLLSESSFVCFINNVQGFLLFLRVVVVRLLSCVWLFAAPWTAAHQVSLPSIVCQSLLKFKSIDLVMLSHHLILCHPLLLLTSTFPSIRVFTNELALCIRWPKYWRFSFSNSPLMNIQGWFPLGLIGLISFLSKGLSRVFSRTTIQNHQFFSAQPSLWSNSLIRIWLSEKP